MTAPPPDAAGEWDVFLAHASEDKETFVRPLAERLRQLGARVWYDEFTLSPGDSLLAAIDRGLAESRHGVLVLSHSFLGKPWPEYERRGLTTREIGHGKLVIPVWLNVAREDILSFSPTLADKVALVTDGSAPDTVALQLLAEVRPDIFDRLARRAAFEQYVSELPTRNVTMTDLQQGPVRHDVLPKSFLLRLRVIHQVFCEVFPISFEDMVRNFQRELRPEREAGTWEAMAATYLQIAREDELGLDGRKELFGVLLKASMDQLTDEDGKELRHVRIQRVQRVRDEVAEALKILDR